MQFTIHGFSQIGAYKLGLNCDDLCLLRWFINFRDSGNMVFRTINGKKYYWISYDKLTQELPIVASKKDTIYRKLKKMVEAGVLERETVKQGGTFSFYSTGVNFALLSNSTPDVSTKPETSKPTPKSNLLEESNNLPNEPHALTNNSEINPNSLETFPHKAETHASKSDNFSSQADIFLEQKINTPDKSTIQKPRAKDEFILAENLINHIQNLFPHIKKPNLDRWASVFAYMLNVDGRTVEEITSLISWIYKPNNFWCCRILNPDQLKNKYDKLLAIKIYEENNPKFSRYAPPRPDTSNPNIFVTQYGVYDFSNCEIIGG